MQKYTEKKKTVCQTFLNINSEYPKYLKTSIPYNQALRIKRTCSKKADFEYHMLELKERLLKVTTKYLLINNSQKAKQ